MADRAALSRSLTFHASFDRGPDADFALGDPRVYTVHPESGELTPGLGSPPLSIVDGAGRFGGALEFTSERTHVVAYQAEKSVAYSPDAFQGTVSFWLSLDPAALPDRYCDPFQLTDKSYADSCVWLDFTKNDVPPDLRLGVFGEQAEWDPETRGGDGPPFYWRLLKVAEPPFAHGRWTHVAIAWGGINGAQPGRARLYLDGVDRGATGAVRERFRWDPARARIRLGTGHYVGLVDDLAFFDRVLGPDEVREIQGLERGVAELGR